MVTPEAPVKAVKKAQAAMPARAMPPGIQPRPARKRFTRRVGVWPSAIR